MQFNSGHAEVLAEGFAETSNFQIAASGKAFKGLIDGIYSRKIEATIRELSTNAFDAHVAAGNDQPFEVHLPTAIDPRFYIRDYGTGMPHALVMRRYSTLFDSTKDGLNTEDTITPNSQVGMLGLGSKAFFSYTDNCTLTIWMDGEARFYSVYMGPEGVPQIALAAREPSDEPVGVKVEFPARREDVDAFRVAATRVFKGFPQAPLGLPSSVLEEVTQEPTTRGPNWTAFGADYLPDGGFYARQGCVLYPIDLTQIDEGVTYKEKSEYDHTAGKWVKQQVAIPSERYAAFAEMEGTVIVDFPIGSLEFDLSRERLAYSPHTMKHLRDSWDSIMESMSEAIVALTADAQSDWEYLTRVAKADLASLGQFAAQTAEFAKAVGIWNNIVKSLAPSRTSRGPKYPIYSVIGKTAKDVHISPIYYRGVIGAPLLDEFPQDLHKSVFIHRDEAVGSFNQRVNLYLHDHGLETAYVVSGELTDNVRDHLGDPHFVTTEDLPKLPKETRPRIGGGGGVFSRIKMIRPSESGDFVLPIDEAEYENDLFVYINCGHPYNPDEEAYPDYTIGKVWNIARFTEFFLGRSVSAINVRKNEFDNLEKFGDPELLYGVLDDCANYVSDEDVKDLINIINHRRFEKSWYSNVRDDWQKAFPGDRNPINAFSRFKHRYLSIPQTRREMLQDFLGYDGQCLTTLSGRLREYVCQRAIELGLETLPYLRTRTSHDFVHPLLSGKWLKIAKKSSDLPYLGKFDTEILTFYRKEIGC